MESDDVVDWPVDIPLGRALDLFQQDIQCPICQDIITNPHSAPCGHSFCSLCIRRHCDPTLNVNRASAERCPCCREKIDTPDLRKNLALASLAHKFRTLGKDLHSALFCNNSAPSTAPKSSKKVKVVTPNRGKPITSRVAQYQLHGSSREYVKRCIEEVGKDSKVKLRVDGTKEALERRLRELIHLANAQLGLPEEQAMTLDECIEAINYQEKLSEIEDLKARKGTKTSSREMFRTLIAQALERKIGSCAPRGSDATSSTGAAPSSESVSQCLMTLTSEQLGPWRVAVSARFRVPFFFNVDTRLGQFDLPDALEPWVRDGPDARQLAAAACASSSSSIDSVHTAPPGEPDDRLRDGLGVSHKRPCSQRESGPDEQPSTIASGDVDLIYTQFNASCSAILESVSPSPLPASQSLLLSPCEPGSSADTSPPVPVTELDVSFALLSPTEEPLPTTLTPTQWICDVCTYINSSKRRAKCEMCEIPNPTHLAVYNKPQRSQKMGNYNEGAMFRALASQSTPSDSQQKPRKRPKK